MRIPGRLWRVLDRLTAFLPGQPKEIPAASLILDPDEPGISEETRLARRRLWRQRYEKAGKGGYR